MKNIVNLDKLSLRITKNITNKSTIFDSVTLTIDILVTNDEVEKSLFYVIDLQAIYNYDVP